MSWTQHVMNCADAAVITEQPVHQDCVVVLIEAVNEPGRADGYISSESHAPTTGFVIQDLDPNVPDITISTEERLNPSLDSVDWR